MHVSVSGMVLEDSLKLSTFRFRADKCWSQLSSFCTATDADRGDAGHLFCVLLGESLLAELYRVVDTLPPHHLLCAAPRSDAGAVVYACT